MIGMQYLTNLTQHGLVKWASNYVELFQFQHRNIELVNFSPFRAVRSPNHAARLLPVFSTCLLDGRQCIIIVRTNLGLDDEDIMICVCISSIFYGSHKF